MMLGSQSSDGKLCVLDFDVPVYYVRWRKQYGDVAQSYTVRTRRGWHVYLRVLDAPHTTLKMAGGEIKATGYVVGEGSVHESGWVYQAISARNLLSVSSLSVVGIEPISLVVPEYDDIEITPTGCPMDSSVGVISRIKSSISIAGFLQRYTALIPRGDDSYMAVCPFHKDHNPSLQIWPKENRCYCHSPNCQAHRRVDIITAASIKWNVPLREAIRLLACELD